MIKSSDILRCINDKSADLSREELERIIDEELEKPENIMDADLIEYCLDALNEQGSEVFRYVKKEKVGDTNVLRVARRFRKVIAVAAAAALLFAGVVSVSALVFKVNLFEGIVEFYDDHIRIRFDNGDNKADGYKLLGSGLAKELADNGISPVLLPEVILSEEYRIVDVKYEITDVITSAYINFVNDMQKGYIFVEKYADDAEVAPVDYLNVNDVTTLSVNEILIYVFEQKANTAISYHDRNIQYDIILYSDFDTALAVAKTIK